ncbi:MAG: hypothetical protein JNK82_12590 [Myxococcaceae bacterium]|nr:hypothetical protein [Myxococcaceae bacterium]
MRCSSSILFFVSLAACGGAPDVCTRLAKSGTCSDTAYTQCTDAIAKAKADSATCAPQVTALVECLAGLDEVECTGSSSVATRGDGMFGGGQNFTDIGGFSVVVNDSRCDVHRRGLEACRSCPSATGARDVFVLGIGDKCNAGGAACATGLSCQGGICTKSCSNDDECDARADGCRLQYQYANVCASGKCTRSCGDDFSCGAWVGASSKCMSRACSL